MTVLGYSEAYHRLFPSEIPPSPFNKCVAAIYNSLTTKPIFMCDKYPISLGQAIFLPPEAQWISSVLLKDNFKVVSCPQFILGMITKTTERDVIYLSPTYLREKLLRLASPRYTHSYEDTCALLWYFLDAMDSKNFPPHLLQDLVILPLANGTIGKIGSKETPFCYFLLPSMMSFNSSFFKPLERFRVSPKLEDRVISALAKDEVAAGTNVVTLNAVSFPIFLDTLLPQAWKGKIEAHLTSEVRFLFQIKIWPKFLCLIGI
jgi:hypothetical protein